MVWVAFHVSDLSDGGGADDRAGTSGGSGGSGGGGQRWVKLPIEFVQKDSK